MKGWRTIVVQVLTVVGAFLGGQQAVELIGVEWVALGIAVINLVLRYFTTTAIGKSV